MVTVAAALAGWCVGYAVLVLAHREVLPQLQVTAWPRTPVAWIVHALTTVWTVGVVAWAPVALVPALMVFGVIGLTVAVVDQRCHRIPNRLIVAGYLASAVTLILPAAVYGQFDNYLRALLGAAAMFAAMFVLMVIASPALGFGDVKLAGWLGLYAAWFGWPALAVAVCCMWIAATIWVAPVVATRNWKAAVPLGPAMVLGVAVTLTALGTFLTFFSNTPTAVL